MRGATLPMAVLLAAASLWVGATAGAATITIASTTFQGDRSFFRYLDTDPLALSDVTEIIGMAGVVTDIAYDPSGVLYAIDAARLYTVDEATGVATEIGSSLLGGEALNALTFDAAGTLYAAGGATGNLYTLDPATGAATVSGSFPAGVTSAGDLAFDDEGVLWGIGAPFNFFLTERLVQLNPGGAGIDVGDTGRSSIFGLVFVDDTLYGIGGLLYELDRSDGSLISETNGGVAFPQGAAVLPVPEPAVGGLVVGGLLLLLAGRRRRT